MYLLFYCSVFAFLFFLVECVCTWGCSSVKRASGCEMQLSLGRVYPETLCYSVPWLLFVFWNCIYIFCTWKAFMWCWKRCRWRKKKKSIYSWEMRSEFYLHCFARKALNSNKPCTELTSIYSSHSVAFSAVKVWLCVLNFMFKMI